MYQWDQFQEVGRRKRFEIYAEIRHFEAYVQFLEVDSQWF